MIDLDKLKDMNGKVIAEMFGARNISILPLHSGGMPHTLYWECGPQSRNLGEKLKEMRSIVTVPAQAMPSNSRILKGATVQPGLENWFLISHPSISPYHGYKIELAVVGGKYVSPRSLLDALEPFDDDLNARITEKALLEYVLGKEASSFFS